MRIEVLNWEKYNARGDAKRFSWFRFENAFFDDPVVFDLKSTQKLVLIYLFACRGRTAKDVFDLNVRQAANNLDLEASQVLAAVEALRLAGFILVHPSDDRGVRGRTSAYVDVRERTPTCEDEPGGDNQSPEDVRARTLRTDGRTRRDETYETRRTGVGEGEPRSSADPQPESSAPAEAVPAPAARAADAAPAAPVVEAEVLPAEPRSGEPRSAGPPAKRERRTLKAPTDGSLVFQAYAAAYERRYGVEPVRDAKANSICAQLVGRLGVDEACAVVAFYLTHGKAYYAERMHDLSVCLADCTGLRTQMLTGRKMTSAEARRSDVNQANADTFREVFGKLNEEGLLR